MAHLKTRHIFFGVDWTPTLPPMEVENGSLEDEFSLQRGHFPLPGLLENE